LANVHTLAQGALNPLSTEHCEEQVRRVVQSATFRNATTLQQLLQFLADKTLSGSLEILKEYTIGVEALGRKPDFDPKIDPIVRVQSHRLRLKLREYYETEGSRDPILVQFPKGHYLPIFELMSASTPVLAESGAVEHDSSTHAADEQALGGGGQATYKTSAVEQKPGARNWKAIFAAVAVMAIATPAYWLGNWRAEKRWSAGREVPALSTAAAASDRVVDTFWARFLGNDTSPVIAYTDAVFLLDDSNDLFRFRHGAIDSRGAVVDPHLAHDFASNPTIVARAGQLYYENGYTGTGELESIAMLAGLLGRMGLRPIIKSSRDVTPNDLNQHNVILLGSPFQNAAVAQLLTAGDFSYQNPDQHREQWRAQILNARPHPGEAPAYRTERDATSQVLQADYSLITIAPGVTPGRSIAILGGLDTKGTEGATSFATSKFGVEQLQKALRGFGDSAKGDLTPFQALVRVKLAKGYQVLDTHLVSVHPIPPAKAVTADTPAATH
jgi:hypothetical protein